MVFLTDLCCMVLERYLTTQLSLPPQDSELTVAIEDLIDDIPRHLCLLNSSTTQ